MHDEAQNNRTRRTLLKTGSGTIDRTVFNCMGWALENWTGTVDGGYGDNMVMTSRHEHDDDGQTIKVTLIVDPSNAALDRVTEYVYDWRHRRVDTLSSVEARKGSADEWNLKTSLTYDNRDLVTMAENFAKFLPASSSSSSAPPEFIRTAKQTAFHDARGRRYRSRQYAVDPATGDAGAYLEDNTYYDQGSNVVRSAPAGQRGYTVNHFDALARRTKTFLACDPPASSSSSSSGPFDPADVANSLVAEQTEFDYDDAGNTTSTIHRQRFDTTTDDGPLGSPTAEPKARVSYAAMYPDGIGRTVASASYGTNGGDPWSRDNDSIPESSDTVLVSQTHFDPAGNATEHTDPTGRVDRTEYDHADRRTKTIENYEPSSSSSSSSSSGPPPADVNKTTHFTYTDDSLPLTQTSDNDSTGPQTTSWVYAVAQAGGSKLNSHRLVSRIILPPRSASSSSSSSSGPDDDSILLNYNTQSQVIERTDQAGTTHAYSFDRLGRSLTDAVTAYGSGIDDHVGVLETVWDARGLRARAVSWNAAATTVRNESLWEYNHFGQAVKEYQAHDGPVDGSTVHVDYAYASPESEGSTPNSIRQTDLIYPHNGTVRQTIRTNYTGDTLRNACNVPTSLSDVENSQVPASYRYLGMASPVKVVYESAANIEFTLGTAASNYPGLDRFGRLVETIWQTSGGGSKLVHSQYGRTRFGGVTWRYDAKAHSLGTTVGTQQDNFYWYDSLYRVTDHQRGTLNAYHTGIDSPQQTEVFQLDQMGNWLAYQSDQLTPAQTRDFNPLNEITELTNPGGVIQPAYDLAANMTTIPAPENWTTAFDLTWDAWNRLVRVQEVTTLKGAYTYDADNRRITTTLDESTFRHFYYSGSQVLEERLGTTFDRDYVWGVRGSRDLVRRRTGLSTPVLLYCLSDAANPVAVINASGTVLERYSYDTYGPVKFLDADYEEIAGSTIGWTLLWSLRFFNPETQLSADAAAYNPTLGVYVKGDIIQEHRQSLIDRYREAYDKEKQLWHGAMLHNGGLMRCCPALLEIQEPDGQNGKAQRVDYTSNGLRLSTGQANFKMLAEFKDDPASGCYCGCCEIRWHLTRSKDSPLHPHFPGEYLADKPAEDQSATGFSYGRRDGTQSSLSLNEFSTYSDFTDALKTDMYFDSVVGDNATITTLLQQAKPHTGCYYRGTDSPRNPLGSRGTWKFTLSVFDRCKNAASNYPSKEATVQWI
jgi:YD repeat-containing protein